MGGTVPPFSSNDWPKGRHSLSIHGYWWLREWIIPSVLNVFFRSASVGTMILLAQEEKRKEKRCITSSVKGKLPISLVPYLQCEVLSGASEALLLCTNAWAPVFSLLYKWHQLKESKSRERERDGRTTKTKPYRSVHILGNIKFWKTRIIKSLPWVQGKRHWRIAWTGDLFWIQSGGPSSWICPHRSVLAVTSELNVESTKHSLCLKPHKTVDKYLWNAPSNNR